MEIELSNNIKKKIEYIEKHGIIFTVFSGIFISIASILGDLCIKAYSIGKLDFWNLSLSYIDNGFDYVSIIIDVTLVLLLVLGNMVGSYVFMQEKGYLRRTVDMVLLFLLFTLAIVIIFLWQLKVGSIWNLEPSEVGILIGYSCMVACILCLPGTISYLLVEDKTVRKFLYPLKELTNKVSFLKQRGERRTEEKRTTNKALIIIVVAIVFAVTYLLALHAFWNIGMLDASMQTNFKLTEDGVVILETEESYVLAENYTVTGSSIGALDIHINKERQIVKDKTDVSVKIMNFDDVFVLENARYYEDVGALAAEIILPFESL